MLVKNDKVYLIILLSFGIWDGMIETDLFYCSQYLRYNILIDIS